MGKILQKKKARSGLSKAKAKNNRLKNGNKKINVLGNQIIAQNWDRDLTLTQNYKRLGLLHKLNAPTGGKERIPGRNDLEEKSNSLHINGSAVDAATHIDVGETKVERDPETGKILRVIHDVDEIEVAGKKRPRANPLNDPLNDLSDNEDVAIKAMPASKVVQQLERQADLEGVGEKAKKPRHQSTREGEWISRLIEKHGDNLSAMARDRKLNPMQQSEGDIRRRINKWKKSQQA
ncbi:Uncharacterized protein PECH_008176 [Penicillium ucsense]|uniref:Nucleolar protein 16 n=1 Tax=Penicillium ucsense TaxID=2839758 RepID=A0A8J8VY23_9EURO|nr:Uncharacterized protein PECM_000605 [Penicillium ucsense]KAF7734380.1 Uncharacterized protein PECH_008176 [Penicillium ucsense]